MQPNHVATMYHAGTNAFYEATVIRKLTAADIAADLSIAESDPILPIDIDLTGTNLYIPCEYRLLHIATNKFVGVGDGDTPNMVDDWHHALYFQSINHHIFSKEGTLLFQWNWMLTEAGEEWLSGADMYEYRVHVLIGSSEC